MDGTSMPKDSEEGLVFLGYVEEGDKIKNEFTAPGNEQPTVSTSDDDSKPPWLVNKIGGSPIFPSKKSLFKQLESTIDLLKCKQCKTPSALMFQINSPIDESSLDRVMQVYTCVNKNCSKRTWYSLRCMFDNKSDERNAEFDLKSDRIELIQDAIHGPILVCKEMRFFEPYYVSVIEEPTGKEDFARNNLEALKLASRFTEDLKIAPIEEKYKNLKNYKPPKPPAAESDLGDFEKFQLQRLYGDDKDLYRFFKRLNRYKGQVVRYDWEGKPLLNSSKIKLNVLPCSLCSSKRKFEFQLMSALLNYLVSEEEFDRDALDFASIVVSSCSKNCSSQTFNLEDTYIMPDPDSRIFNKVKQRVLELKIKDNTSGGESEPTIDGNDDQSQVQSNEIATPCGSGPSKKKKNKRKKSKK